MGYLFGGNSPHTIKVYRLQKRIIRIMLGYKQTTCRELFKRLNILPLASRYILLHMIFVIQNKNLFTLNSDHYEISTRQLNSFYQPMTTFIIYQKGIHHMGIKIFNSLPQFIKDVSNNTRKFENCLKRFLHTHSFYSTEEYFLHKSNTN